MIWGSHGGEYEDGPDIGGSTDLWNVGKLIPVYTALEPKRLPPTYFILCRRKSYLQRPCCWVRVASRILSTP
jgi:hypothetical protein